MTKVTGPLFGTQATGKIGPLGAFRAGRHGPEFVAPQDPTRRKATPPRPIHACFAAAKAAHSAITPTPYWNGIEWRSHRLPSFPDFWRQWLIDHPECRG